MRGPASLVRGLQHRLHGRPAQAAACFEDAALRAEGLGARLWHADALFELGLGHLEEEGRASQNAKRELERALSLFRACGAAPSAQRAHDALATLDRHA